MSSRPVSNLERILASVHLKEDDVVVTPEPAAPRQVVQVVVHTEQLKTPPATLAGGSFFSNPGTPGTWSKQSSVDVPLTKELLTPDGQNKCSSSSLHLGFHTGDSGSSTVGDMVRKKRVLKKRSQRSRSPFLVTFKGQKPIVSSSDTDGSDTNQEEREGRLVRYRRKRDGKAKDGERSRYDL